MPLTIESYPHLAESIISSASPETLLSLRATCSWFKSLVDPLLYAHLTHEIASDSTRTVPLSLPVDLWSNPVAVSFLRVLDLHLGNYADPNTIEIDLEDWDEDASEVSEEWKEDTAKVLPRAAGLMYAVLYGSHTTVFRHVLQNRHVPTLICPVRQRDFQSDWLEVPKASVGAYVPTNRVWIVAREGPGGGVLKMQLFKEKPLQVTIILLPPSPSPHITSPDGDGEAEGQGEGEDRLWFYDSLVETSAFESTDTSSFGIQTPDGEPYPDTPATFLIVGLEAWNASHPLPNGETWESKFRRDFANNAEQRYDPDDAGNHLARLEIGTLDAWKREISKEEWGIVQGVELE